MYYKQICAYVYRYSLPGDYYYYYYYYYYFTFPFVLKVVHTNYNLILTTISRSRGIFK
jgi:hypothetical protein